MPQRRLCSTVTTYNNSKIRWHLLSATRAIRVLRSRKETTGDPIVKRVAIASRNISGVSHHKSTYNKCGLCKLSNDDIQVQSGSEDEDDEVSTLQLLEKLESLFLFGALASTIGWTCTIIVMAKSSVQERDLTAKLDTRKSLTSTSNSVVHSQHSSMQNMSSRLQLTCIWVLNLTLLLSWIIRTKNKKQNRNNIQRMDAKSANADQMWKAISKLTRQQSKSGVKQRIARRIFEGKLESLSDEHVAMNDALLTYSKEFKRLQSEVGQIYSILGALEKAIRSQTKIVSELATEAANNEKDSHEVQSTDNVQKNPSSSRPNLYLNTLQVSVLANLNRSSNFDSSQSAIHQSKHNKGCKEKEWTTYKF